MMKKVIIGMSGGVDSSVAALLLKEQGYEVIGVTMIMCHEAENPVTDAEKVAKKLGIEHHIIDCSDVFEEKVKKYFTNEYLHARTPNPCVMCNRTMKWEFLLNIADGLSTQYVATGHYARVLKMKNDRYTVRMSRIIDKDQTYALCMLTQEQLSRTLMPIGEYEKSEVRQLAEKAGLNVAEKKDSMEICFIPDHDYGTFVERFSGRKMPLGDFKDKTGKILGTHNGLLHYTIGQRKGLNLAMGYPVFVTGLDSEKNEVIIGQNEDVFSKTLICSQINFMGMESFEPNQRLLAKIRYAHKGEFCLIEKLENGEFKCCFEQPVRAVTPGQTVVFYEDGCVMAGGVIQGR